MSTNQRTSRNSDTGAHLSVGVAEPHEAWTASHHCTHEPRCPAATAPDGLLAHIVVDHLQDCGYALLCNGLIVLDHGELLA
ncbi:MAG: DUF5999 family protein [Nocardioidaceae bacterium]